MQEDLHTVTSMIWNGFPVLRLLLAWAVATLLLGLVFFGVERATRRYAAARPAAWYRRGAVFLLCWWWPSSLPAAP